ncbi:MAG TPA: hypothetical protein VFD84_19555 [Candidatus Binatia bacterium]|nr:hypothetical protein [Candidatus Binatia bacterium]
MPTTTHMATAADDARHAPGPGALPLWNESFWFPFYDPKAEIGVVVRVGTLPRQGTANVYLFLTHRGDVVHALVDHALPHPALEPSRLALPNGLAIEWTPRERFRLRYAHAAHGFDVEWTGTSPTYLYPHPPEASAEEYPRHIEHAGTVRGTVTIAGRAYAVDALAHRDHSWGGERDWAKMWAWDYLSGEFGPDLWFNAVRIRLVPDGDWFPIGCLWDGRELHAIGDLAIDSPAADGGTCQAGVEARFTDERGRPFRMVGGAPLVTCPVQFGRTWLKDGIVEWRCGARTGFGIHELGYVERE